MPCAFCGGDHATRDHDEVGPECRLCGGGHRWQECPRHSPATDRERELDPAIRE